MSTVRGSGAGFAQHTGIQSQGSGQERDSLHGAMAQPRSDTVWALDEGPEQRGCAGHDFGAPAIRA